MQVQVVRLVVRAEALQWRLHPSPSVEQIELVSLYEVYDGEMSVKVVMVAMIETMCTMMDCVRLLILCLRAPSTTNIVITNITCCL